jgi:hypothetical protein
MKKLLLWQLLIPLLIASGLAFGIAHLLNKTVDYSSIFLNLATDFIMVVITIWYVDRVLKRHEEEKWKDIDRLLEYKLYTLANSAIETICLPIGIHNTNLTDHQLFVNKLRTQSKGTDTDYYGDFAKKFLAGLFITDTEIYHSTKEWSKERIKTANMSSGKCQTIYEQLKKYRDDTTQIIDLYGTRVTAQQLKALMNFQSNLQNNLIAFDNYMARDEWWLWYQHLFHTLPPCLEVLESSSLHWTIVGSG